MTIEFPADARCPVRGDYRISRGDDLPPLANCIRHDEINEEQVGVFYSEEFEGYYVVTDHDSIREVLQDPLRFSSRRASPIRPAPPMDVIPITLDPPQHTKWRRLLQGYFSPRRVAELEPGTRATCRELIEDIRGRGSADVVASFTSQFPTTVFLELLGLPAEDLDQILEWEHAAIRGATEDDPEGRGQVEAKMAVMQYLGAAVAERRRNPDPSGQDIVSQALDWVIDGRHPSEQELLLCCLTLFEAGLDTVTSQLGYFFLHLATHPGDRERITEDPSVIPAAVEELLRAYPIITLGREVVADTIVEGQRLKPGDVLALPLMAAGRDEEAYAEAREVRFDREPTHHLSFGAGPHRCLGSHLARMELRVALEEWHRLIPDYEVADLAAVTERSGQVCGLVSLPLQWPVPAARSAP